MKYLVTGGAGFIGSHLIERLLADGHQVICIDDLSTGYKEYLPTSNLLIFIDAKIQKLNIEDLDNDILSLFVRYSYAINQFIHNDLHNGNWKVRKHPKIKNMYQIVVYDLTGKHIKTLINKNQKPGYHSTTWNGNSVPSGLYICRLSFGNQTITQKMLLMK